MAEVTRIRLVYEKNDGTSTREAVDLSAGNGKHDRHREVLRLLDQLEFRLTARVSFNSVRREYEVQTPQGTMILNDDLLAKAENGQLAEALALVGEWKRRGSPT